MKISYSFIIPVYNRPQEVRELLESFTTQTYTGSYEIVLVEDGSSIPSAEVITSFRHALDITYFEKPNSGPGASRNYGMERARGNYFIILDSDCILPPQYLTIVDTYLQRQYTDCFGGADAAHEDFNNLQKAINYVMTSFFTTGGIRGSKNSVSNFEPRSFNMGISKRAFEATGGFARIHPGEDPDLSHRIETAGFQTKFIPNAFVYHKRRISWDTFYKQVQKFGTVRPILNTWHPKTAKLTYWFPSFFVFFTVFSLVGGLFLHIFCLIPLLSYLSLIFLHSSIRNKHIGIGVLSVWAVFVQFFGYGLAFLKATFLLRVLKKDPEIQFPQLFFK